MCAQQRFISACAGLSESSQGALWIAKDSKFLHAGIEESDLTARMRRLIWVFGFASDGTFSHVAGQIDSNHEKRCRQGKCEQRKSRKPEHMRS